MKRKEKRYEVKPENEGQVILGKKKYKYQMSKVRDTRKKNYVGDTKGRQACISKHVFFPEIIITK